MYAYEKKPKIQTLKCTEKCIVKNRKKNQKNI